MPDFFIVGGQRCGTTSLHYYLNQHHLIFLPDLKEPHYYSQKSIPSYLSKITNKQDYLSLFNRSNSNFKGDSSTSYLMDKECPELIKKDYPNSKIIICLRNPIERTYSAYLAQFRSNRTNLDFDDIIKIDPNSLIGEQQKSLNLLDSNYFDQVSKYIEIFIIVITHNSIHPTLFTTTGKNKVNIEKTLYKYLIFCKYPKTS